MTGPISDGTKLIVTDFSLKNYLAQQYNLHLEKYPKHAPENLRNEVFELFKHAARTAKANSGMAKDQKGQKGR